MATLLPAPAPTTERRSRSLPPWASGLIGIVGIIAVWWLIALITAPTGGTTYAPVPTPIQVAQTIAEDGPAFYWANFSVTIGEAAVGYFWGNLIALVLSALVLIVPWLEGIVSQLAVVTYCVPIVAIGTLVLLILGGSDAPGRPSDTAIFLAGLSVFFTTVVGSLLGLKAADKASLDVVTVYGGTKFTQLRKVRAIAALPNILSALQIAVPAAFLGAILGEYFGKIETGVGPILVAAQVSLNSPRVWALFLLCAAVALIGYGLVGLIGRLVAPWSSGKRA
ncbi:ABC transporter permease subunit [Rathayibacter festucae]|uniref:ABC transporter permease n=1 Tax=Rathayibacter TaxID=33886 RepID=UPI000FB3E6F1|nr:MULTISPECIES: ABC transporter permease subunit [Rathayibacter]MCJ1701067.1 ABC transporter permease subunit [Rathayibacter festucae]ROQ03174.1 ABC-type nitrate/sulfonate/bicarbonate transport system permease component [Rathayibacter sp. PhB93]TDQ08987.1 ABC-type nitrate/sulfonate/bicarbonate transport system permease component [Rathayibacter sp. PhB1]TDX76583.1 ABC-type nitrate/sulfonate/bicarbonate transport system permease component [Rathayibacter sp. PhB151]